MDIEKLSRNTLSIIVAFAILFSGIPILTGSAEVDAATPYWKSYAVKSSSYTNNTISWKGLTAKQKKKISGIAIFQGTTTKNLKCVKRIGKGNKAYKNTNVRPGVKYCYQLRTYKVKKVKQKQYYNKKTKRWQTKKIKRAKTRRVNVPKYTYSNKSAVKWVTTARKPAPNNPSNDNPGTGTGSTFDYKNIPEGNGVQTVTIGDGTTIYRGINNKLKIITDNWMANKLPKDATDAEKVNMAIKCMNELMRTPESITAMGDPSNWVCGHYALYFDTCCKSAGVYSATRSCLYDEDYGAPFYSTHINNFVWINGTGYIMDVDKGRDSLPQLSVINYDWQNWHIITTNTDFDCRYY